MPKYITKVCPVCGQAAKIDSRDTCCSRKCANVARSRVKRPATFHHDRIEIHLNLGYSTIIDHDDAVLAQMNWTVGAKKLWPMRLHRVKGKKASLLLHRVIMERMIGRPLLSNELVDHANRNKLDNRRANLRLATYAQNSANSSIPRTSTSGTKGVRFRKDARRWEAHIKVNQKYIYLGLHDTLESARDAYMRAAIEHFGEFATDGQQWMEDRADSDDGGAV